METLASPPEPMQEEAEPAPPNPPPAVELRPTEPTPAPRPRRAAVKERGLKPRRGEPAVPCYTALAAELDQRLHDYATTTGATKRSIIEAALDAYLPS